MITIEFSADEVETLREVLGRELRDVDVEVFRTDSHDFKEMLKRRRELLERIGSKLASAAVPV